MSVDPKLTNNPVRARSSLYESSFCDRVLELGAQGCCREEIAAALRVSRKTISTWMKTHQEFRDAMIQAKELEYAWWLAAGREGQFKSGWKTSGWLLQMRNRFGKRFDDKAIAAKQTKPQSADRIRDELERKLSRLADARREKKIPEKPEPETS